MPSCILLWAVARACARAVGQVFRFPFSTTCLREMNFVKSSFHNLRADCKTNFVFHFSLSRLCDRKTKLQRLAVLSAEKKESALAGLWVPLPITFSYKTYACKYLHLCPTLLTKFNSTQVKNLRYSICIIACVSGCFFYTCSFVYSN